MPWEAKRWVLFAVLMAIMSLYALTYRPSGASQRPSGSQSAQTSRPPEAAPALETETAAATTADAGR